MALGIIKSDTTTRWEILLTQGDLPPDEINNWNDNTWIIGHLRQLADKIEKENPRIINVGLYTDCQYKSPRLYLEFYERKSGKKLQDKE